MWAASFARRAFSKSLRVLVTKKHGDVRSLQALTKMTAWLDKQGVDYLLDPADPDSDPFSPGAPAPTSGIDLIVCLGGDGTVLRTVDSLGSDEACDDGTVAELPPVLAFAVGSLGFLTPHSFNAFESTLSKVLASDFKTLPLTHRSRLRCEYSSSAGVCLGVRRVLNECLVARGGRTAFHKLDLFVDDQYVAQFQADGIIIATPSGSSAYSLSAGGSLVAPSVPAILVTPIAPHGLSTRPLILPDSAKIKVRVPDNSRSLPIVSFDGQSEKELNRGETVTITSAVQSVPFVRTLEEAPPLSEWFSSLRSKLRWAQELRAP
jgi:NAD+ kinase